MKRIQSVRILDECPGCHRRGIRELASGLCGMCYNRRRRAGLSTEQRERELESSRTWKRRNPEYWKSYVPREPQFLPTTTIFCWYCNNELVEYDSTDLCGFCKEELPAWSKLMAYEFPESDTGWRNYFAVLTNEDITELEKRVDQEIMHRTSVAIQGLLPKLTQLYRTNGKPPSHHQSPQLKLFGASDET